VTKSTEPALWVVVMFLLLAFGVDHLRLIQVRQLLMDRGTPIELDAK